MNVTPAAAPASPESHAPLAAISGGAVPGSFLSHLDQQSALAGFPDPPEAPRPAGASNLSGNGKPGQAPLASALPTLARFFEGGLTPAKLTRIPNLSGATSSGARTGDPLSTASTPASAPGVSGAPLINSDAASGTANAGGASAAVLASNSATLVEEFLASLTGAPAAMPRNLPLENALATAAAPATALSGASATGTPAGQGSARALRPGKPAKDAPDASCAPAACTPTPALDSTRMALHLSLSSMEQGGEQAPATAAEPRHIGSAAPTAAQPAASQAVPGGETPGTWMTGFNLTWRAFPDGATPVPASTAGQAAASGAAEAGGVANSAASAVPPPLDASAGVSPSGEDPAGGSPRSGAQVIGSERGNGTDPSAPNADSHNPVLTKTPANADQPDSGSDQPQQQDSRPGAEPRTTAGPAAGPFSVDSKAVAVTPNPGPGGESAPASPSQSSLVEPPADAMPRTARDLSLRLEQDNAPAVSLSLTERGGGVHVSVRTADAELGPRLQSNLDQLVNSLRHQGVEAEASRPGLAAPLGRPGAGEQQRFDGHAGPNRDSPGGRQRQRRQNRGSQEPAQDFSLNLTE